MLGHLQFCSGCKRAHDALREVSRRVKALGLAPLPAGFLDRLERRRTRAAAAPAPAPPWLKLAPVFAAAALVVVFGLTRRRPTPVDSAAEGDLRTAMKRAPALEPPPPEAQPKRPAAAPAFSNESQAEFLASQQAELGIRSVGAVRAEEDLPVQSMFGGSITDPEKKPQVEATMRRMAAISRAIRERSGPPEVAISGTRAPVLGKAEEGAAGAALFSGAPQDAWSGQHSQNLEGTRTVYDAAEWAKVWRSLSSAPLPAVDFKTSQVVAVFLGPRDTGGYAAEITGAVPTPTALIVQWLERAPEPGVPGPDGATSPYALRVVPRTDLPVRYQKLRP